MKETRQKICRLLLLYARDSSDICQEFLRQIDVSSYDNISVDDPVFSNHRAFQNADKSRLQIIFFSPGFLNFLECRPEEAFVAFRYMDPASALAVFCCGLREQEVMCYHMAPLNSYNSWPKFEVLNTMENGVEFPQHLLQTIQEVFPSNDWSATGIVVVPKLIYRNKEGNNIYIIFPGVIQDISSISVYLESERNIQIIPESMNPYVVYFKVPGILTNNCGTIGVKIQQSRRILVEEKLSVIQERTSRYGTEYRKSFCKRETSSQELELDQQLRFLSDFASSPDTGHEDEAMTIVPQVDNDDTTKSLVALCKKYGLEELTHYISEPSASTIHLDHSDHCHHQVEVPGATTERKKQDRKSCMENSCFSVEDDIFQDEDTDGCSVKRSLSLPSLLPPADDNGTYGEYLDMATVRAMRKDKNSFPDHCTDDSNVLYSTSSNGYVYMEWPSRDSVDSLHNLKRGSSESQQELLEIMLAFKRGEKTISNVEEQFQSWHRKQVENPKHSKGNQENQQSSASFIPGLRTLMQRKRDSKIKKAREMPMGWTSTHPTAEMCPLYPQTQPPPLPPRPATLSNSVAKPKPLPRKSIPARLPPNPDDDHRDDKMEHFDEYENIQSFIKFCEEHELEEIGKYFLRDCCFPAPDKNRGNNSRIVKGKSSPPIEIDTSDSRIYLNVPSKDWDSENNPSGMRRSLSLPSTLCSTEAITNDRDNHVEIDIQDHSELLYDDCASEDYFPNSFCSDIYMSVKSQLEVDSAQNQPSLNCLSNSQQELLELMHAFKEGQRTISQVEHQFQEWHQRHMETSSHREKELLQLKNEYVKAQKQSIFGLPDIKNFILGKPKKKPKISNPDIPSTVKPRNGKSERDDSNRLSKISFTSTSSGVSESGEVFRSVCFVNPEYGRYQESEPPISSSTSPSKPSPKKTPPLPPRTPITPACQLPDLVQENINVQENDNISVTQAECSILNSPKSKPSPPPKPPNLMEKVNRGISTDITEGGKDNGHLTAEVPAVQPDSPDYIVPNRVRFVFPSQALKKSFPDSTKEGPQKYLSPPKLPVLSGKGSRAIYKKSETSISVNCPTLSASDLKKKNATQKRQLFRMPKSVPKKEESMFYVASRKWSSFPDLTNAQLLPQPTYMELVDVQDRRTKSISDS